MTVPALNRNGVNLVTVDRPLSVHVAFGPPGPPGPPGDSGIPDGGDTGYVLTKLSPTNLDMDWQAPAGGIAAAWGTITGDLADQVDLQSALDGKATAAQGVLAGTALQPGAIGVSVQGYSAVLAATTASYTAAEQAKLAGIAAVATANADDAALRDRATHTGTQSVATITGLGSLATQSGTFSGVSSGTNTGDQASIVGISGTKAQFDTAVTDGNVQWVGDAPTAHTHLLAAGATDVTITAANLNTLDDGADNTLHFHAADRARSAHTGTQLAATISDFDTAVAATGAVTANTAKVTNATHTGDATGAAALTLATVNANVGSFGLAGSVAQFVVNAKGLITAAANVAISIASTAISDSTAAGRAFLTAATAADQTALLDVFTSGDKGLAPASGGGTSTFLRADGVFASPPAGGGDNLGLGIAMRNNNFHF